MKTLLTAAAAALIAAGSTAAYAQTSNIFGHGGTVYAFTDTCARVTIPRPGISDHEALNLLGQQVTCLAHREKRMRNCYAKATLTFLGDHPQRGPEGDWAGVDELKACGSL